MKTETILITGAGKRVGLHLAQECWNKGYDVIAHYHTRSDAIDELEKHEVCCIAADFNDASSIQALVTQVQTRCSSLRAIIHNASVFEKTSDDIAQALQQMEKFFRVHMMASYHLSRALSPLLMACESEHADIVQISDIYADNPNPAFDVYCASKAGAQNLALSLAKTYAPKIKVNVIQPGPILFKEWHDDSTREKIVSETLLKKEGGVDAIAQAVMAILNNPYQTGSVVAIDGGRRLT